MSVGFQRLDPFSGGPKKGNLFFGLVKVFRRSLILQALLLVVYVCDLINFYTRVRVILTRTSYSRSRI